METDYLRTLRSTVLGPGGKRLVLLCNFEAEVHWARHHVGLPNPGFATSSAVVGRMEELGVLLAGAGDVLILKEPLDAGYRRYLVGLGLPLPTIVVPENAIAGRSTTEDVLSSPGCLRLLGNLAREGAHLLPMGTTELEEKVAAGSGLPLAVPDAATFERVNDKIYGRRLTAAAGLRQVPGRECRTVAELADALAHYREALERGRRVVVKDAFGVSGKGLVVLDRPGKADGLLRMVRRRADRSGDPAVHVVVEEWVEKRCDLNYQLRIGRDGAVGFDFVKQALTDNGVHRGHLMPAELTAGQFAEIERAAAAVGAALHRDGFHGVAGVDAIIGADETTYPVLEINARLNMSTYQGNVTERCLPAGHVALARHYSLRLARPLRFDDVRHALGGLLDRVASTRFIVTCFGTVNAGAGVGTPFEGRLYALLVAPDRQGLATLDATAQEALAALTVREEIR